MNVNLIDPQYLEEAIRLSREGMQSGQGGPFGAVIVKEGIILGRGQNLVTSTQDPTAHAEIVAIRQACIKVHDFSLAGAVLYTSCEPCPMCLASAYWAKIQCIVFANTRKDAAQIGFDDEWIYQELSLSLEKRSLPIIPHTLRTKAIQVFHEWENKQDKIRY